MLDNYSRCSILQSSHLLMVDCLNHLLLLMNRLLMVWFLHLRLDYMVLQVLQFLAASLPKRAAWC
jgi:hypothetical protein